jgi:transketolase
MAEPIALVGNGENTLVEAFGEALAALGHEHANLVVLDADTESEMGAHQFRARHPERFLQFGMAEQNMIAAAGGLAAVGLLPVVTGHAVSCLRAVEQVRHSAALSGRNVKIVANDAGLEAGHCGGAGQALEDLAVFRAIAGMTIIAPADDIETALATRAILAHQGPVYMRTGAGPAKRVFGSDHRFEIGKGTILRAGTDVTLVACGGQVARAIEAADLLEQDGISARVVNMATIKPIDADLLADCARETGAFVTAEEHNVLGGLGGAVAESLARSCPCPVEFVGVTDRFGEAGAPAELAERFEIGATHIAAAAKRVIARKPKNPV